MPIDKVTVERLAKAWFAESKLLARYTKEIAAVLGSN